MTDREIQSNWHKVTDLLSVKRLKEALDTLHPLVADLSLGEWTRELEELDTTYRYMLSYTVDGIPDPGRAKIYQKLVSRIYRLNDRVRESLLTRDSVDYLLVQKRIFRDEKARWLGSSAGSEITLLVKLREGEPADYNAHLSFLFRWLWLSDDYSENEISLVKNLMESASVLAEEKASLLSALNMGLWRFFDPARFDLLFTIYERFEDQLKYRALFGLFLAFYQYDQRLQYHPEIRNRFLLYDDDGEFKPLIQEIVIQLIRSKDTEKLTKRMQDEILPEMMKLTPQLKKKLDLDKLLKESLGEDKNPDWEDLFSDAPGLKDKMEELTELQMEGSDVFMSSFSMLKHFPFFNHMANWFYPFTIRHPEIIRMNSLHPDGWFTRFIDALSGSAYMCNSDKYSFCYGIQSMPDDMKQFLSDGLKAESEQMGEIIKDEELLDHRKKASKIIRQYAQDIYRFYKLYPQKKSFNDLYTWKLDVYNSSFFQDLFLNDHQLLHTMAGFYFKNKYYPEAVEIYELLIGMADPKPEMYQKAAYSYQQLRDYHRALALYLKADLLLQDNIWNLKKIAQCYRYLNQPEDALNYFRQAEYIDPDDLHTEVSIGHCLLELEDFEGALKSYFKVEYLEPENHKVWRPIAWCSFVLGKFDQARKYYEKLLAENPGHFDYMNLGHVEWSSGNRPQAVELYRQSISRKEISLDLFLESFEEDKKHLIGFGVEPDEIPIILDHLRYSLE